MQKKITRAEKPAFGSIRSDELLLVCEAARRLKWERKTLARAKKEGLKTTRFGRSDYVFGKDLLAFFTRLAATGQEGAANSE